MFIVRAMHMSAYGQMDVSEFQSPFDASWGKLRMGLLESRD